MPFFETNDSHKKESLNTIVLIGTCHILHYACNSKKIVLQETCDLLAQ